MSRKKRGRIFGARTKVKSWKGGDRSHFRLRTREATCNFYSRVKLYVDDLRTLSAKTVRELNRNKRIARSIFPSVRGRAEKRCVRERAEFLQRARESAHIECTFDFFLQVIIVVVDGGKFYIRPVSPLGHLTYCERLHKTFIIYALFREREFLNGRFRAQSAPRVSCEIFFRKKRSDRVRFSKKWKSPAPASPIFRNFAAIKTDELSTFELSRLPRLYLINSAEGRLWTAISSSRADKFVCFESQIIETDSNVNIRFSVVEIGRFAYVYQIFDWASSWP